MGAILSTLNLLSSGVEAIIGGKGSSPPPTRKNRREALIKVSLSVSLSLPSRSSSLCYNKEKDVEFDTYPAHIVNKSKRSFWKVNTFIVVLGNKYA